MEARVGDYLIKTDSMQYIVQARKIVEAGKLTKPENIGKEKWVDIAYASTLEYALKFIRNQTILDNQDLIVIKDKLDIIQSEIKGISNLLKIRSEKHVKARNKGKA